MTDSLEPLAIAADDEQTPEAPAPPRPSFGTLLIDAGLVTREQLYQALAEGTRTGERLGEVLIRRGLTSEHDVARMLSDQFQLPLLDADSVTADPAGWDVLPSSEARRLEACVVGFAEEMPVAALADPSRARFNSLRQSLGAETRFAIVTARTLNHLLDSAPTDDLVEELSAAAAAADVADTAAPAGDLLLEVGEAPVAESETTLAADEVDVFDVPIATIGLERAVETIGTLIDRGERGYACLVNVHLVETARRSPSVRAALHGAALNLPDGAPVAWLAGRIGRSRVPRVTGSDLFAALCEAGRHRHFFLGSTPETLRRLVETVQRDFPDVQICGVDSPPFRPLSEGESRELAARVNEARPDIVWVGLGAPQQELWMRANRARLHAPVLIGVGAVFDFASGTKPRAPRWLRRAGLEWVHRLVTEPRRLWRRYLVTNSRFLAHVPGALARASMRREPRAGDRRIHAA
jgi:N-acetylglucosaminyldiphosphoundecaprenol N-acetyl-beta-D-mannosaminyltransferase